MDAGRCELLIRGAEVIDGSGEPRYGADVAVEGGRIAAVGDLAGWAADESVDGRGHVLCPGFIDVHTHDDLHVLHDPAMACKVSQGVTTVIAGNCGISAAPLATPANLPPPFPLLGRPDDFRYPSVSDYRTAFDRARPAVNLALLAGHSTLRLSAMADPLQRAASEDESAAMARALELALAEGCIGLSSGLDYPPASGAPESEMTKLAAVLRSFPGAVYATHMRDEGDGVVQSVEETLRTGAAAGVPVVISHHKCAGKNNYGRSRETLRLIASAPASQAVGLDVYPYTASSTSLIPRFIGKAEKILVAYSDPHPEHASRPLDEIASEWNCGLEEAAERLYPAGAIYFQMDESDLRRILAFPKTMIGSDGLPAMAHPHPRLWGTFPRVLSRYVREQGLLSLEEAVHRMTGLSARTFGLKARGLVRPGHHADLVLFDPLSIEDAATYEHPVRAARGVHSVFVNGKPVWRRGGPGGERPGAFVRRGE